MASDTLTSNLMAPATASFAPTAMALSPSRLRDLSARSDAQGLSRAASHYAAVLLMAGVIGWVLARWGLLAAAPLVIVQGYLVAFLFSPMHESAHKTAFRSRRLNIAVGQLSGLLIIHPYEYYALYHWDHHRYTQDPDRDPELLNASLPMSDTALAIAFSGCLSVLRRIRLLLRHALTGRVTAPWVPQKKRRLVITEARAYLLFYGLALAGSIGLGTGILVWTWLVPLFLGQLFLRPYLLAEHTGCTHTRNAYENTRTTYTNAVVRWFSWNMPYHAEHHAYPSIPFHALPRLNVVVGNRIMHRGRGYVRVVRECWGWMRRARPQ